MTRVIKTLEALVADVRRQTGRSPDRNFGIDEYDSIKYILQCEQIRLWWEHDWKFLRRQRNLTLKPGQRYYDIPGGLSFERIRFSRVHFGGQWIDLIKGVDETDYSLYDSDNDQRADPALKFDYIDTAANNAPAPATQIEIWPVPVETQYTRWTGIAELGVFISDDDPCTLDGLMLTLFAAAKIKPDDKSLLQEANRMFTRITAGENRQTSGNKFSMNGNPKVAPNTARKRIVVMKG